MGVILPAIGQVTLDSCRHMALRNNKQMAVEQLKVEQAGYQRKQAQAAYKPSIDFAGTYMHTGRNISLVDIDDLTPTQFLNPATGNFDFVIDAASGMGISIEGSKVNAVRMLLLLMCVTSLLLESSLRSPSTWAAKSRL